MSTMMGVQKVYSKFIVEKDGSISNISVVKGLDDKIDNEIIRVLGMMPNWTPGKEYGSVVRVKVYFPITFKKHELVKVHRES